MLKNVGITRPIWYKSRSDIGKCWSTVRHPQNWPKNQIVEQKKQTRELACIQQQKRRFDEKENVGNVNVAKSSVLKGIRSQILDQFQQIDDYMDQILPKKEPLKIVKCHDHIELFCSQSGEILFFRQRDGPLFPTLKLLHKYPFILPHMQVDKGAIHFVLSGANIMCPGLTSPGARMTKVDKDQIVAIMAEGKQHALAIGYTKLSTDEIIAKNKGVGVDNVHFLNDGLWVMKSVK